MYHILRYNEVLVKIMTQRLNIARILPTGFVVLCLTLAPIQHDIIENRIKSPGSIKNVIRFQPSYKTIAIINNIVMTNEAIAQLTQAPLSISLLSRLLICDSWISSSSFFFSVIWWPPVYVYILTVLNLRYTLIFFSNSISSLIGIPYFPTKGS